jgi:predicted PurR-regulated permease PerM
MKKNWNNNNYLLISLYAIFVIIICILFYRISSNTDNIFPSIMNFFNKIKIVLSPILYGLILSYLFNPIMQFFENNLLKIFKPKKNIHRKQIRTLSIIILYIFIFGSIILMIRYFIPQILVNITELMHRFPQYMKEFNIALETLENTINERITGLPYQVDTTKLFDMLSPENYFNIISLNTIMSTVVSQAFSITSSLFKWLMAIVISFYALERKESFVHAAKRASYSLLKESTARKMIGIFKEGHEIFIKFFIGKFIDSFIIGIICFIGLSLIRNPYALLLSVIVGITNMIPYFGPFLGAIPAVLITLFDGFLPAATVAGFIFLLQQFDGLVLGPKILGDSLGLSPFWIISGIIVGGALWGPLGMFFACPLIAITLVIINRWMDKTLFTRQIVLIPLPSDEPDSPPGDKENKGDGGSQSLPKPPSQNPIK